MPPSLLFTILQGQKGLRWLRCESSGENGGWNPRFSRAFNHWELEQVQNFIGLSNNKLIIPLKKDKIVWKGNKNG